MWHRQYLNANAVHCRLVYRLERQHVLDHLHDELEAWCQLCDCNAVEDMRNVLGWCDDEIYKEIRTAGFEQLICHTDEVSMVLGRAVRGVLRCVDGDLLTPLKPRSGVSAWDAVVESRY